MACAMAVVEEPVSAYMLGHGKSPKGETHSFGLRAGDGMPSRLIETMSGPAGHSLDSGGPEPLPLICSRKPFPQGGLSCRP